MTNHFIFKVEKPGKICKTLISHTSSFIIVACICVHRKAFPQTIQYNRFLGIFEEIRALRDAKRRPSAPSLASSDDPLVHLDRLPRNICFTPSLFFASSGDMSKQSGSGKQMHRSTTANDESEHDRTFEWVKTERVPLFFRTDMFREFKVSC